MGIATSVAKRLAPWAEVVPGYGPVTVGLLLTLPDDGHCCQIRRSGALGCQGADVISSMRRASSTWCRLA